MQLKEYARVRLVSGQFEGEGVLPGAPGYIIEVYDDAYEVEFSDRNGTTIAILTLGDDDVVVDPEDTTTPGH